MTFNVLKKFIQANIYKVHSRAIKVLGTEYEIDELIEETKKEKNKDPIKIFLLLKNIENFKYMIKYYGIPEEILLKVVTLLEHFSIEKKKKIYSIGDSSDYFYIIIRGSVLIEEKGEMIKGIQQYNKKCILKEGFCFGEYEILIDNNRIFNSYANNNCDLLGIKRERFMKILSKYFIKSQNELKNILMNFIPCFKKMSNPNFVSLLSKFILEKIPKQHYIYKEGSEANSLYLILNGRSRCVKNGTNLLYLGINDLVGFESINFDIDSKENPIYNCSIIAIDDCYVLKIKIGSLGKIRFKIKEDLNDVFIDKNNLFNKLIDNGKKEREKFKILYRENLFKEDIKNAVKKIPIEKIKEYFYVPGELKENKKKLNIKLFKLKLNNKDEQIKYNTLFNFSSPRKQTRNFKSLSPLNSENKNSIDSRNNFLTFSDKTVHLKKKSKITIKKLKTRNLNEIDNHFIQKSIGGIRTGFIKNISIRKIRNKSINTGDFDLPLISMYKSTSY